MDRHVVAVEQADVLTGEAREQRGVARAARERGNLRVAVFAEGRAAAYEHGAQLLVLSVPLESLLLDLDNYLPPVGYDDQGEVHVELPRDLIRRLRVARAALLKTPEQQ